MCKIIPVLLRICRTFRSWELNIAICEYHEQDAEVNLHPERTMSL